MTLRQWNRKYRRRKKKPRTFKPYHLYALELEDGYYYVGIAVDVEKRFALHSAGEGAVWTSLHKPIRIIETRPTPHTRKQVASRLEDQMTLDYALLYGEANVRGGRWCRIINPQYPKDK